MRVVPVLLKSCLKPERSHYTIPREYAQGTYDPRHNYRRYHHAGFHRGQHLRRSQSCTHFFDVNPRGSDFDGDPAEFSRRNDPGKQHRTNGRFGSGHTLVDHFRFARTNHDRLLDRLSILDLVLDLRARRNSWCDVLDTIASRVGDEL